MLNSLPLFQQKLLAWYGEHARDLPWRRARDPYAILVAEVLLQQTWVEQALGYYARFLGAFPNFASLARASEEVLRVWAGTGYYRRARNLHRLAQIVSAHGLPRTAAELAKLPGVGPYTAAAVAAIAFGEPVAVVDGNVRRVLARLFAHRKPTARWLKETAGVLLYTEDPGRWNQALMELGALLCTPQNPACPHCPVASFCAGKEAPDKFPEPRKRRKRDVRAVALVLRGRGGYVLERRDGTALGGPVGRSPRGRARCPSHAPCAPRGSQAPNGSGPLPTRSPTSASRSRCTWPPGQARSRTQAQGPSPPSTRRSSPSPSGD